MNKPYMGDEFLDLLREVSGRIQHVKEIGISHEELLIHNQFLEEAIEALINEGKGFISDLKNEESLIRNQVIKPPLESLINEAKEFLKELKNEE